MSGSPLKKLEIFSWILSHKIQYGWGMIFYAKRIRVFILLTLFDIHDIFYM